MSGRAVVDSVEFARKGDQRSGELAPASLERLSSALFDTDGQVRFTLRGFVNSEGKPGLRLRLSGMLGLVCQRCLGRFDFELATNREFVLVGSEEELQDVAEEDPLLEHIPADPKLDLADFVESEILLELPISPLHLPDECSLPDPGTRDSGQDKPFGALGSLKRNS